jgi:hypothetical protein
MGATPAMATKAGEDRMLQSSRAPSRDEWSHTQPGAASTIWYRGANDGECAVTRSGAVPAPYWISGLVKPPTSLTSSAWRVVPVFSKR